MTSSIFRPPDSVPRSSGQSRPLQDVEDVSPLMLLEAIPVLRGGGATLYPCDRTGKDLPLALSRQSNVTQIVDRVQHQDWAQRLLRKVGGDAQQLVGPTGAAAIPPPLRRLRRGGGDRCGVTWSVEGAGGGHVDDTGATLDDDGDG
ncbi:hypothetical protein TIFTF001_001226 [Ficus carica]|uniref:Uncharacterized protein n=1 Tax=Ficus carica TaxID=3494 RepID=A0AA87Z0K8_FICCA|nr:hypothetical protein TIFTF001_001226 [Ficus carica]